MTDDGIITYEKLYDVLRLEKYKKELQKLDQDFHEKVTKYLSEKNSILQSQENKDSIFASQSIVKTKRQLENVKLILKEIYEKREGKILQMALFNSRTGDKLQDIDALLDYEIKFYNEMVSLFDSYRGVVLNNLLLGFDTKKELVVKKVKFLQPTSKFIGDDMQVYGPFQEKDIAVLPLKVSEILIKNNRAEIILD